MDAQTWQKVKRLLEEALDLDDEARQAYVEKVSADNPDLATALGALLSAHEKAGEFLEAGNTEEITAQVVTSADDTLEQVGPYKILEKIGEGGMGIVYLAEQEEPIRRRVALKLIKAGMDTREVISRFEAERQALALLNHPNIAKVFDAGETDTGRPYFVMEYVEGESVTKYCDRHRLDNPQRLELFLKICEAVHHAHQKGIIHRDIKPSNVIVGMENGSPEPKVIDFGVAKATAQRLTGRSLFTSRGALIGTPEYMSPEQADGSAFTVDTRTDIYSLGAVLYELLVGVLPVDPRRLRKAAILEMQRILREEDPPKPSTRLAGLGETAGKSARDRGTDARSLSRSLKGDLDWIVLKALEKDPARRYYSAMDLGEDIRRYMADEPVVACPPSQAYRLRKFVTRHRVPVLAGLLLAAALVVGFAFTSVQYLRAERERARAETARAAAEQQAYVASIGAAAAGLQNSNLADARTRLMQAPEHLRAWEWDHLYRRTDISIVRLGEADRILVHSPDEVVTVKLEAHYVSQDDGSTVNQGHEIVRSHWNAASMEPPTTKRVSVDGLGSARSRLRAVSPDGECVAIGNYFESTLVLRCSDRPAAPILLDGYLGPVKRAVFSRDGSLLATSHQDGLIVWSTADGSEVARSIDPFLRGPMAFSPDGAELAIGRNVRMLNIETGEIRTFDNDWMPTSLAFSADGSWLAAGSVEGVAIWDARTGRKYQEYRDDDRVVRSLKFTPDGEWLAAGHDDGSIDLLQVDRKKIQSTFVGHDGPVHQLEFARNGRFIVSLGEDGARVWHKGIEQRYLHPRLYGGFLSAADFSADGKVVATGACESEDSQQLSVWDTQTGENLSTVDVDTPCIASVAIDPNGRLCALSTGVSPITRYRPRHKDDFDLPRPIEIRDLKTGRLDMSLEGPDGEVPAVAFRPDGGALAGASGDGEVLVWNLESGDLLRALPTPHARPQALAWSNDGSLLATGTLEGSIFIWRPERGEDAARELEGHSGGIVSLAFSPTSNELASGSADGTVRIWAPDGKLEGTLDGHPSSVTALAFTPDGTRLVSGDDRGTLRVWDPRNLDFLVELDAHSGVTTRLAFDATGSTLLSAVDTNRLVKGGGTIRNGVHAIQRWRTDTAYRPRR